MIESSLKTMTPSDEGHYPSVELAYPIAIASYDLAQKRWDAIEGRIQTILALVATVVLALPIAIHNSLSTARFSSIWFWAALCVLAAAAILGGFARVIGQIKVLDPNELYERCLHYSPWEFKKNMVAWAGQDFRRNKQIIHKKATVARWMLALFFFGDLLILAWVLQAALAL